MSRCTINDVVNFIGLESDPKAYKGASNYYVKCPFCHDKSYHLNIDVQKECFRCILCGTGGGKLDLYALVKHGRKSTPDTSKDLFKQMLKDMDLFDTTTRHHTYKTYDVEAPKPIQRADDSAAHKAYSTLLSFSEFKLTEAHRENLRKRGLPDELIVKNGYRSMSLDANAETLVTAKAKEIYNSNLKSLKNKMPIIQRCKSDRIIAGLEVANRLLKLGINMNGVPGFYKLGTRWCFRLEDGMYIPTRNIDGEIVALQVRKDVGDIRYKTISSKDLPCGVTTGISRTHFCLQNAKIGPDTLVLITEGPLKADVALSLMEEKNVAFLAIHGVNNTAELQGLFADLHKRGVRYVYNYLDMDKCTKPQIAAACKKIRAIAEKAGLKMVMRFWAPEKAQEKMCEWLPLFISANIPGPSDPNIFVSLTRCSILLQDANIAFNSDWDNASKGIDDYLLTLHSSAAQRA